MTTYLWDRRVQAAAEALATTMGSGDWKLWTSEARAALKAADEVEGEG